jgi:hypothetical protein
MNDIKLQVLELKDIPSLTEDGLIAIATFSEHEDVALAAMKRLQGEFDPTYVWCNECDGLVVREMDCCLNKLDDLTNNTIEL